MRRAATEDRRRRLPRVDQLLEHPTIHELIELYGREQVRVHVRRGLENLRAGMSDETPEEELESRIGRLPDTVAALVNEALGDGVRRVINATGIFLHTNLGRAPLPRSVADRLPGLLNAYCDLELDLTSGLRGERNRRAERLLTVATGAEAALVTNNNAAAVLLVLATLAKDREVIISRGELIEIGGSFRIPELLAAAGSRLIEVGTTNRTHLRDYERAIGERTALLLKVDPSNYRISGFVAEVEAASLVELGRRSGLPVLIDEGSGMLTSSKAPQLAGHASLRSLVELGCDLACGSGDKLLGGPQAGLLVGRSELIERCHRHPLYRALRPNRATCSALEMVLKLHLAGKPLLIDRMWPDPADHHRRLERVAAEIGAEIVPAQGFVGGGSAPEAPIDGEALALAGSDALVRRLRLGRPAVMGYLRDGRVLLDLRTVDPEDDGDLMVAIRRASDTGSGGS